MKTIINLTIKSRMSEYRQVHLTRNIFLPSFPQKDMDLKIGDHRYSLRDAELCYEYPEECLIIDKIVYINKIILDEYLEEMKKSGWDEIVIDNLQK